MPRKRIGKRDIKPLEVRFNLQEIYDRSDGAYKIRGSDGTTLITIDPINNTVSVPSNETITSGTEFFMPISIEHFFTGSAAYLDNTGTSFALNADDFPGFDFAYQSAMSVETGGRTAFSQLYNITDVTAVVGSEISSTDVGIVNHDPTPVRSAGITFPSGEKEYIAQRKQVAAGNGGDNMHMYLSSLVFIKT